MSLHYGEGGVFSRMCFSEHYYTSMERILKGLEYRMDTARGGSSNS